MVRFAWSVVVVLLLASLPGGAVAQGPNLEEVRRSVDRRASTFWERAWVRELEKEANDDGSIDWQYDDRQQLGTYTNRYQRAVEDAEGMWTHLQVQDYLQRQLLAVQPNHMMPGRPGAFSVRILRTNVPNALAFSDGTILLTAGLLASLGREAELDALLAHEVAHVVLDHALANYQSSEQWDRAQNLLGRIAGSVASIMTPLTGGSSGAEASEYGLEMGLAGEFLDPEIVEAAGQEYDEEQEEAANRLARKWLRENGRPATILHVALEKARRASLFDRTARGATFTDLHPVPESLRSILASATDAEDRSASDGRDAAGGRSYDTHLAALLEKEAELEIAAHRYRSALPVLDRAIEADWARPRAYLLKAHALRHTTVDSTGYDRVLALLDTAAARAERPEPRIDAERALVHLRRGRPEAARRFLERCVGTIDSLRRDASADTSSAVDATSPDGRSGLIGAGDEERLYASLRTWAVDMTERLSGSAPEAE